MAHHLSRLFRPGSIAVFGGTEQPDAVGHHVLRNLLGGGYPGELHVINPKHSTVLGRPSHPNLASIGKRVELAVVATPAATVPSIVQQCGEHDVRAVIVLSSGFLEAGPDGAASTEAMLEAARRFGVRVLGPNCLGLLSTGAAMNATFGTPRVAKGSLALVSQSGALCTAILDWAEEQGIGFSNVISIGEAVDVGVGEILDYLSMDPETQAILVYLEGVRDARRFMSGLRVAARLKPTVVLKSGKHEAAARAARSHTGALIGADDVFDAALRRAGAVRVNTIGQLFSAAELLGSGHRSRGQRLAVITNAGGPGVMAVDQATANHVELATLAESTIDRLNECLPDHWSRANPVDLLGDATPRRYREALEACLLDPSVDGLLVMLTPQAMTAPTQCAEAVVEVARGSKPVVACWMGGRQVREARDLFRRSGVPHFNTPEASMDAFAHLWAHHQNQLQLLQVTSPLPYEPAYDTAGARSIIESVLAEPRHVLTAVESKAILSAFGIACTRPVRVSDRNEALVAAENLGFPVVMKIDSPDVSHKSDVGGVVSGIATGTEVGPAFTALTTEVRRRAPNARVEHATVEPMYAGRHGRELMLGVSRDPCFGPAISVGAGGTLVELMKDRAVGLPPLTTLLADEMIDRTRVAPLLDAWRGKPAVARQKLQEVLLRLSDLVCELPEVLELDINPLMVDETGALALDARIVVQPAPPSARPYSHLAIAPYPAQLTLVTELADGTALTIRPIRPEDAQMESAFVRSLSNESRFFRFMQSLNELTPEMLRRFTQIDYDQEMAFIATVGSNGAQREIGVSRYITNPDGTSCEFALVVADEWQRKGVGTRLMKALIGVARSRALESMRGEILEDNRAMLKLVTGLGFRTRPVLGDTRVREATLDL